MLKICPFTLARVDYGEYCKEFQCTLWLDQKNMCALKYTAIQQIEKKELPDWDVRM